MSINKKFYIETSKVEWNGQEVCEVRGLTPDDIAKAMSENAGDMESLLNIIEGDKNLTSANLDDPVAMAAVVEQRTEVVFTRMMTTAPNLVAKLIAIACDSPTDWEYIKKNYVVPLQFEIATQVARLTFVDSNGFKAFVGNVLALVQNVKGQQQQIPAEQELTHSSEDMDG